MKKFLSLFRANTKGDLNVFKIKGKGKIGILIFLLLSISLMYMSYTYADLLMNPLHEIGLSYIGLTLFSILILVIVFMKGVNNSQGLIFEAKDNNLLFAMPIKQNNILIVRFLRILLFDYIFILLFLIPVYFKYILLNNPNIYFYIISIVYLILLPLIPLVVACIIGYIIKSISVSFKNKKLVQIVLSLSFVFLILYLSSNLEGFITDLVSKASSINDVVNKIYLPIGLYIELINEFNLVKFIELIMLSIIPAILFIVIFSKYYGSIINRSKENISGRNKVNRINKIKSNSIIKALTIKEVKYYFSVPIYVFNTILSPILVILFPIGLIFKYDVLVETLVNVGVKESQINSLIPYVFIAVILILLSLSTITACSISLEGKRYSFLKSLPIKENKIFLSKILLNDIIMIPAFIVSAIVYIIYFKIFNYNIIFILLGCILLPHLNGQIGLLINLIIPKFDYKTEVEVVKQSMAVLIDIMINILLAFGLIYSFYKLLDYINGIVLISIFMVIILSIIFMLHGILSTYGIKRFREID